MIFHKNTLKVGVCAVTAPHVMKNTKNQYTIDALG